MAYVKQKIAELVNGPMPPLDTLKELADALGNDPNFATTIMTAIGKSWMLPQRPRRPWQMGKGTTSQRPTPPRQN